MIFIPYLGYLLDKDNIYNRDIFRNGETLNIFSDGSFFTGRGGYRVGGYSAIGVIDQDVIQISYRGWFDPEIPFSGNVMELYGLKEAISMAYLNRHYPNINIFSDSQYAVDCVKTYIYKWTYDPIHSAYKKSDNKYANNIEVIYEVATNLINLMMVVPNVNLYFLKGHIDQFGSIEEIKNATERFRSVNNIQGKVDYNLIRYLSKHNDLADHFAKRGAREIHNNKHRINTTCPVEFIPQDINEYADKSLVKNDRIGQLDEIYEDTYGKI